MSASLPLTKDVSNTSGRAAKGGKNSAANGVAAVTAAAAANAEQIAALTSTVATLSLQLQAIQDHQAAAIENAVQFRLTTVKQELYRDVKEQVDISLRSDSVDIQATIASLVNPAVDGRIHTAIQNVKVEFSTIVGEQVVLKLTDSAICARVKTLLGIEDEATEPTGQGPHKRRRKEPKKPHQAEVEQLIHYFYHLLLKKVHCKPQHWTELPAILVGLGVTGFWPRPTSSIEDQPVYLLKSQVSLEDTFIKEAIKEGDDIDWNDLSTLPVNGNGPPASGTSNPSSSGAGSVQPPTASSDTSALVEVWRPDWDDDEVPSSISFKAEIKTLCQAKLASPDYKDSRPVIADDLDAYLKAYWTNAKNQYEIQLDALIGPRWFNIERSPLKLLFIYPLLKLALAYTHSPASTQLSDDDEGRFILREDLDERMLYYLNACNSKSAQYDKDTMWEAVDPFWMTYECLSAMLVLDMFCSHGKKGVTPVFRTPYSLAQKDWDNVKWPVIRPRDKKDPKKPAQNGDGVVIYRFMVNHGAMRSRKGYDAWQLKLYDDPIIEGVNCPNSPVTTPDTRPGPTLKDCCEHPDFASMGLWDALDKPFEQRGKRVKESDLIRNYRELMADRAPKRRAVDKGAGFVQMSLLSLVAWNSNCDMEPT